MDKSAFKRLLLETIQNVDNRFHPFVWIHGEPEVGRDTSIGGFSEVNARNSRVRIGANCDIASFVAINCLDSHRRCIGLGERLEYGDVWIGDHVFVGSHSVILGGAIIGSHSVIAAGTVVRRERIPPFSLVVGNPATVKAGYYRKEWESVHGPYAGRDPV